MFHHRHSLFAQGTQVACRWRMGLQVHRWRRILLRLAKLCIAECLLKFHLVWFFVLNLSIGCLKQEILLLGCRRWKLVRLNRLVWGLWCLKIMILLTIFHNQYESVYYVLKNRSKIALYQYSLVIHIFNCALGHTTQSISI